MSDNLKFKVKLSSLLRDKYQLGDDEIVPISKEDLDKQGISVEEIKIVGEYHVYCSFHGHLWSGRSHREAVEVKEVHKSTVSGLHAVRIMFLDEGIEHDP